jgi:predicted aldo/keto reductase-like oxidoreductase
MKYKLIANKYKVSCVGIGGHYAKMEEGSYEERYADVSTKELAVRTEIIEKAVDAGINYFDTTFRNEVDMLSKSIKPLNIRDKIFINGMV